MQEVVSRQTSARASHEEALHKEPLHKEPSRKEPSRKEPSRNRLLNRVPALDVTRPEILEAVLESHLRSYPVAQTTQLEVCAEPEGLHLRLTDATCPDPLLMMNYLGARLATLPIGRSQRVSFSGASNAQGRPTWIGFIDVAEFADAKFADAEFADAEFADAKFADATFVAVSATPTPEDLASPAVEGEFVLPELRSPQDYERFITDQSSWFTPAVKANARLHNFAKATQRKRIAETAELLAHTLTPTETLLDVMPVRYCRRSSSLILTNQRLWCVCESLRLQRPSTQDLFLFLSDLEQIEIAENGLRVQPEPQGGDQPGYQSDDRIYFNVGESQNLEILLSYFTRVVRRPVIAETTPSKIRQAAGLGLVASLVLGIGWTVAGEMDVFLRQVPLEQQAVEPQGLDAGNLNAQSLNAQSLNAQSLNAQSLNAQTPTVEAIALPSLATSPLSTSTLSTSTLADSHPESSHCLDRFNQSLNPNGYAALNRVTQTLMIRLEQFTGRYVNGVEFDALAEQMAQEVFASCDRTSVNQVRVEDGRYSFFRGRNAKNYE